MANDDVDDALSALTKEEIGELVELIDPDVPCCIDDEAYIIYQALIAKSCENVDTILMVNSCLHPSERMPPQTTKQPTGPYNRDHLLSYLKQQAETSKIGEDYIPYQKEIRGKVYKPKEPVEKVKQDTKKSKFTEELDQMLSLVEQDDLADLASELGLDEISTRISNSNAKANSGAGLIDSSYKRSESPVVYPKPDKQDTDIGESIARLLELDPTLITLNLNNHPELDQFLFQQLCDALVSNTYLTSLHLAGTSLGDNQAKMLVPVLKHNFALHSLNLDSNCLTGSGIKMLLVALKENTSLKELKLSNQKHSVGAGIEMEMAKLISNNTTLLKFGYSFTSAGPRVMVEKYMMRNIEISRKEKMLL